MPRFIRHPDAPVPKSGPWQSLTISQAIRRVLSERSAQLRPRTITQWKSVAKKFHAILPIAIRDLTKSNLHHYQKTRLEQGAAKTTVRQEVSIGFVALSRSGSDLRIRRVACDKSQEREGIALTEEEQLRLLTAAQHRPALQLMIHLGLCGLRYSEALHLQRCDWKDGKLSIRRSKTQAGVRRIPLPAHVAAAMNREIQLLRHTNPEAPLFPHRDRPTDHQVQMQRQWTAIRKAADLEHIQFHDLRHTAITELCEKGVPDWTIRAYVGHVDEAMMKLYSHPRQTAMEEAAAKLTSKAPSTSPAIAADPQEEATPAPAAPIEAPRPPAPVAAPRPPAPIAAPHPTAPSIEAAIQTRAMKKTRPHRRKGLAGNLQRSLGLDIDHTYDKE